MSIRSEGNGSEFGFGEIRKKSMKRGGLKILYIAHERKLGGATLSLLAAIDEMRTRGHEIYVMIPVSKCPLAQELQKRNIPFYSMFFAWIQMPSYWNRFMKICFRILYLLSPLQVCYIYHIVRKKQIDIIHSNSSVIDFGAMLAQKLNCKHVWHIREFGDRDYSLEYLKTKKKVWEYMNSHTDKFIFISKRLYEYFADYADSAKSEVIYNGISDAYIIHRNYTEKEKIVFLISGNLTRSKGQMLLLQAAKELKNRNYQFEVWIAGSASSMSDSKLYEAELKMYIDENLTDRVTMLGRIADMKKLREKADVEIVASSMEAFGRVTVEAMMGGMPVIGSDSGANPELICNGSDGLLFKNGNYMDLAAKMEIFLNDYSQIRKMGENAQIKACNRFLSEENAERIENLYYNIMDSRV